METLIKDNNYKHIKTQADAVIYFIQTLDIEMIDMLLSADRTYQDFAKPVFIKKLGLALEEFKKAGDTYLNRYQGHCNSRTCNFNCGGFAFVGNHSGNYLDLIVVIEDGEVTDMYECIVFKTYRNPDKPGQRIKIDKLEFLI